ncbi:hypothetical protein [Nostoc sp. DedQUE07]|uniref:hypothetical protein n=1 Tax=Nostoc sp. DedQUE07 TaxID=3075392 RepID=UPI002AD30E4C|nr:hypothetical protein [Nostoc sp. DedQUE07]MDZ8131850.1 hypothetical protein [Nostoc sp. DedQUE07]
MAATTMGMSVEKLVRRAINEFADSLQSEQRTCKEGRTKGATVEIYDDRTVGILQDAVTRTALTQSTVIHRCLKKYLEHHKPQIRQNIEAILEKLNQVNEVLVA